MMDAAPPPSGLPFALPLLLGALLVAAMLAIGTALAPGSFGRVVARPGPVALAVVVNVLVLPAVAVLLLRVGRVDAAAATGIMLAVAAPGGGSGALLVHHARGDAALSVALQVLLALAGLVAVPGWTALTSGWHLTGPLHPPGSAGSAGIGALALVAAGVLAQLVPLSAGVLLARRRPGAAATVHRAARRAADALLVTVVLWALTANAGRLRELPAAAWLTIAALVALGLAVHAVPQAGPARVRTAVAMTTTVRNLSLALFMAQFAAEPGRVVLTVLSYGLAMYAGAVAAVPWARRLGEQRAHPGAQAGAGAETPNSSASWRSTPGRTE